MKPSEQALEMIKSFEGLRCRAYKAIPEEKYYTIGYGHCSPDITRHQVISPKQADQLLLQDVGEIAAKLDADTPNLEQHQYDALISMIYNIGWYNYRHSMLRESVRNLNLNKTPEQIARRMTWWVRASGKVLLGLQKRRVYEANHFLGYEHFKLSDGKIIEL